MNEDEKSQSREHVAEVRERTATLEAQTEAMRDDIHSLDEKQDEILKRVRNLDNSSVDTEEVEKNTRMRHFLKWGGGVALAVGASTSVVEWLTLI